MGTSEFQYAVLIETASNQRTIFQTNRLRENIGASQLIYRVGKSFARRAINAVNAKKPGAAKPVVLSSGKAIVLARNENIARDIIEYVTWETLEKCPGVIARGAYAKIEQWTAEDLEKAIQKIHREVNDVAARLPSPAARFPRLPFVENCASSGYPARAENQKSAKVQGRAPAQSEVILARRRDTVVRAARARIRRNVRIGALLDFLKQFEEASENKKIGDWIAIVHADGNGLGQIFLNFKDWIPGNARARNYVDALSCFSKAIDEWSRTAAQAAISETWRDTIERIENGENLFVPVVPVILGGDDLTVICEGKRAVRFAARYLTAFEEASRKGLQDEELAKKFPRIAQELKFLAAAAGVAIVKPHFPFHRAYELVEQLLKSAKTAKEKFGKTPCSALDFQVVFDTSGSELEPIRDRMTVDSSRESLTMRPYVVTPLKSLKSSPEGHAWACRRHYSDGEHSLEAATEAILRTPKADSERDDPSHLPRSQAHSLHEALYFGRTVADGRLAQIQHRYGAFPWKRLTEERGGHASLFIEDGMRKDKEGKDYLHHGAYLLDAMELADLARQHALDENAHAKWGRP